MFVCERKQKITCKIVPTNGHLPKKRNVQKFIQTPIIFVNKTIKIKLLCQLSRIKLLVELSLTIGKGLNFLTKLFVLTFNV